MVNLMKFIKDIINRYSKSELSPKFGEIDFDETMSYCPKCFHHFMMTKEIIFGSINGKTQEDCEGNCPKCDHKHRIKDRLDRQRMRESLINKLL